MSTVTLESVLAQVEQLSPEDRLRLLEHLAIRARGDFAPVDDWRDFIKATYGAFRDMPLERLPQGEQNDRDVLE